MSHSIDNTSTLNETNADIANTHDSWLSFTANVTANYTISGFYETTGEARTYLYVYLIDNDATPYTNPMLYQEKSESLSTEDESFSLDSIAEGDHYNLLYGSLTGEIIAGHNYSLFIDSFMYDY